MSAKSTLTLSGRDDAVLIGRGAFAVLLAG